MNIIKIEFKKDYKNVLVTKTCKKLLPVTLTIKKWFFKAKKIDAYPTTYGHTYGSDTILYFVFVDEYGKEFSDDVSKQINNWIRNQEILGLFPS